MKKKVLMLFLATLLIVGDSNLYVNDVAASVVSGQNTAQNTSGATPTVTPTPGAVAASGATVTPAPGAEVTPAPGTGVTPTPEATVTPTPAVPQAVLVSIRQNPSKVIYEVGEALDLSDMLVAADYVDGTSAYITDYQVTGYNPNAIGPQTVFLSYQNLTATFSVTVMPKKVTNVSVSYHDTSTFTLTWDSDPSAVRYEVYILDELNNVYNLYSSVNTNSITLDYPPATVKCFQICAVGTAQGVEYKGGMSDSFYAATNPEEVNDLLVTDTTAKYITLDWSEVPGATGYLVYRSPAAKDDYQLVGTADTTTFTDQGVASGTSYQYKVCAYVLNETFQGEFSLIVDTSTNPAKMVLRYKVGEEKIRLSWAKVQGATAYDLYMWGEDEEPILLQTVKGGGTVSYIVEGLETDGYYEFHAVSRRYYQGNTYFGEDSDIISVYMEALADTSTEGKLFITEEQLLKSWSYQKLSYFSTYVDFKKSFVIPGLATTNVGGFSSTAMCPQAITFVGNYLLMTAYDMASEENSVIYVMNKKTKELVTTLILPNKTHAGGITFDGSYVWVTSGSTLSSIAYSDIKKAISNGGAYNFVNYMSVCSLGITTSYATYYDGKVWVGSYNELKDTIMNSYIVEDIDGAPALTLVDTMAMPTRVQGVAFTSQGTLVLSRSCQLYKGLRGYMRQIDVYKPDLSKKVKGVIQLGKVVNTVSMPSMNEGVAIDGNYLYVNFESGAFDKSTYKMDRICAFKLTDIVKKKTK
ncbi:MAG TPA: hypothetical protein GXX75_15580 [Clostridiales bacterium]|nr:hypothetical protein [Clostridiales bacterium]